MIMAEAWKTEGEGEYAKCTRPRVQCVEEYSGM